MLLRGSIYFLLVSLALLVSHPLHLLRRFALYLVCLLEIHPLYFLPDLADLLLCPDPYPPTCPDFQNHHSSDHPYLYSPGFALYHPYYRPRPDPLRSVAVLVAAEEVDLHTNNCNGFHGL